MGGALTISTEAPPAATWGNPASIPLSIIEYHVAVPYSPAQPQSVIFTNNMATYLRAPCSCGSRASVPATHDHALLLRLSPREAASRSSGATLGRAFSD